jgi:hypothetical protein
MKTIFKVLIISVLCLLFKSCKSTENTKERIEQKERILQMM